MGVVTFTWEGCESSEGGGAASSNGREQKRRKMRSILRPVEVRDSKSEESCVLNGGVEAESMRFVAGWINPYVTEFWRAFLWFGAASKISGNLSRCQSTHQDD